MKTQKNKVVALSVQPRPVLDLAEALAGLQVSRFIEVLREAVRRKKDSQLKTLLDALVIQDTETAFRKGNSANIKILTRVAREYTFKRWLNDMNVQYSLATRVHLLQWWGEFMNMAREYGYKTNATDTTAGKVFWKATRVLAEKIQENPISYHGLQALTVNQSQHVEQVLGRIPDAIPFIEVLIGERMEELRSCPEVLFAFVVKGSRTISNALWNTGLVLQRG